MNICVIGLGSMGKRRIRLLNEMDEVFSITGIDNNIERVKEIHKEFGITCFNSLMDTSKKFDCVFVCTAPLSHGEIIQECLNRNCHVFSELNLTNNLYDENIQLAEKKGKVLFLSSTPMYKTEMKFISNRIKQNGEQCAYHYHVGQYLPSWHPWDSLKNFFASNKATNGCRELLAIELPWLQNVFGKIIKVHVIKRKISKLELEFPDTYLIQIEHEGGSVGNLTVDVVSRQAVRRFEVFNENLYIRWDGMPDSLYEKDIVSGVLRKISGGEYIHMTGYADCINEVAYLEEIRKFFDVIKGEKQIYGFKEDMEILRIIDEIEGLVKYE